MKTIAALAAALFLLPAAALAQEGAVVEVALEAYLVNVITQENGSQTEEFLEADAARPGQMVEYRLLVSNASQETLPAGSVAVTGPLPPQTFYLEGSATPSDASVRTEFSADDGVTFSEPPVMITVTAEDGSEQQVVAEPASYQAVRWTLLDPFEPGAERTFVYRAQVR